MSVSGPSRNMAGKSKGGKNKGKAQGAGQPASAEPEVLATDEPKWLIQRMGKCTKPLPRRMVWQMWRNETGMPRRLCSLQESQLKVRLWLLYLFTDTDILQLYCIA